MDRTVGRGSSLRMLTKCIRSSLCCRNVGTVSIIDFDAILGRELVMVGGKDGFDEVTEGTSRMVVSILRDREAELWVCVVDIGDVCDEETSDDPCECPSEDFSSNRERHFG